MIEMELKKTRTPTPIRWCIEDVRRVMSYPHADKLRITTASSLSE
jgi:hypothetical protein